MKLILIVSLVISALVGACAQKLYDKVSSKHCSYWKDISYSDTGTTYVLMKCNSDTMASLRAGE